jgi:hypothetical protein
VGVDEVAFARRSWIELTEPHAARAKSAFIAARERATRFGIPDEEAVYPPG